jgi:hypothetical protein
MTVKTAISGSKGFDCNSQLSGAQAAAFKAAGMDFCIRYLPRTPALIHGNLSALELEILLAAGLSVGAVQHCRLPNWSPSAGLGAQYGQYAGSYAASIGLPEGMNLWLDLETPAIGATGQDCIDYAQAWFNSVKIAGYVPGLYIGYGVPLTAQQLFELPFSHYWKAYNYDDGVATRGFQLIQKPQQGFNGISIDPNECVADHLGGLPIWVSA